MYSTIISKKNTGIARVMMIDLSVTTSILLKLSRALFRMGMKVGAVALLCQEKIDADDRLQDHLLQ